MFLDEVFDDFVHVCDGDAVEDTVALAGCLPPQFRRHYDGYFVKRFLICAVRVADRLATWREGPIPASTAECLALRAMVERAEAVLQMDAEQHGREPDNAFEDFVEAAFPDMDVNFCLRPRWTASRTPTPGRAVPGGRVVLGNQVRK